MVSSIHSTSQSRRPEFFPSPTERKTPSPLACTETLANHDTKCSTLNQSIKEIAFYSTAKVLFTLTNSFCQGKLKTPFHRMISSTPDLDSFIAELRLAIPQPTGPSSLIALATHRLVTSSLVFRTTFYTLSYLLESIMLTLIGKARYQIQRLSKDDYIELIDRTLAEVLEILESLNWTIPNPESLVKQLQHRYPGQNKKSLIDRIANALFKHLNVGVLENWRLSVALTLIRWIFPYLKPQLENLFDCQINQLQYKQLRVQRAVFHFLTTQAQAYQLASASIPDSNPTYPADYQKIAKKISQIIDEFLCPLANKEKSQMTAIIHQVVMESFSSYFLVQVSQKIGSIAKWSKIDQLTSWLASQSGIEKMALDATSGIQQVIEELIKEKVGQTTNQNAALALAQLDRVLTTVTDDPKKIDEYLLKWGHEIITTITAPISPIQTPHFNQKATFIHTAEAKITQLVTQKINRSFATSLSPNRYRYFLKKVFENGSEPLANWPIKIVTPFQDFCSKNQEINLSDAGWIEKKYEKTKNVCKTVLKSTYALYHPVVSYFGGRIAYAALQTWQLEIGYAAIKTFKKGAYECKKIKGGITRNYRHVSARSSKKSPPSEPDLGVIKKTTFALLNHAADQVDRSINYILYPKLIAQTSLSTLQLTARILESL
ncbi:MAG: hypothetical protein AAF443_06130 [Chlamydiota bacterium]